MNISSLLPLAVVVISAGAGLVYVFMGDLWRGLYWMAVALVNSAATWGIK